MSNNTSPHILNTAANLLGFCLVVMTSLHIADIIESQIIDELTSIVSITLSSSCILSFISIRTADQQKEKRLENIADYLFMGSLIGILVIIIMITLNLVK
ncbi:MAG: hypothetical protein ABI761_12615 [Saprospiraceae bacterium]